MGGLRRRMMALVAACTVTMVPVVLAAPSSPTASAAVGAYQPLSAPQRLLDTRPGLDTADHQYAGIGIRPQGGTLALQVAGRAGVPGNATSVVLNITVDGATQDGFVTAHPCDAPQPNASNLNYRAGQTIPNTVVTRLSASGSVCLFTSGQTHLIVDVAGMLSADAFRPLAAPQRLLDTRPGLSTADGQYAGVGLQVQGATLALPVAGRAGVSPTATAVVLNVTVDAAQANGFVTVYPCDAPRPTASNLNFVTGLTIPNAVITRLAADGTVCLFTSGPIHLVVDVAGELATGSFMALAAPQRVLDTRAPGATADGLFSGAGMQPASTTLQLRVGGRVDVPANASAVVLNVTAVDAATPGFVTTHPRGTGRPNASNLNFVGGQVIPNLVIAGVGPAGDVCLFTSGATHLIVDVAGWLTGPAPAASGSNCPSSAPATSDAEAFATLLVRPRLHQAIGQDRIAVWVCDLPGESTVVDPGQVASWAQSSVAPYFADVSRGRYSVVFTGIAHIPLAPGEGTGDCEERARSMTGAPYTSFMITDNGDYGGGVGSPGLIGSAAFDRGPVEGEPPTDTWRGFYVGGGSTSGTRLNPSVVVHEIGHTLHWPHSYSGQADEYDNRVDVMSGEPDAGWCEFDSGFFTEYWPCVPQHTLAFNRFAAGWVDGNQVAIQRSGTVNYTLDAPARGGVQFVALPDPGDGRSMLTIEARPAVGHDRFLEAEGVALHVIDQVPRSGYPFGIDGISTDRRQKQALGAPESYEHVVGVGSSLTVHGVTVTVLGRIGDTYEVTVSGTYHMPPAGFFAEGVSTGRRVSCATLPFEAALANGCPK